MKWNQVTWYSRVVSFILFLGVVPVLSFYIGMRYGEFTEMTRGLYADHSYISE